MTPAAIRQKRYRFRKAGGLKTIQFPIGREAMDAIEALGWLAPEDRGNPRAVSEAFARMIDAWSRKTVRALRVTQHPSGVESDPVKYVGKEKRAND